jgi:hypothetical protein
MIESGQPWFIYRTVIRSIHPSGEWLFTQRTHTRADRQCAEKLRKYAGFVHRSMISIHTEQVQKYYA